jgi:hypothetical protein
MKHRYFISFLAALWALPLTAQITLKGKITDAETGEAVPFAYVFLTKNNQIVTTTDFDGYYKLPITSLTDSITVSYIGYRKRTKAIDPTKKEGNEYMLNFQVEPDQNKLKEVVISSGEDPAYNVMRQVLKNKDKNDKRTLEEYEFESYVKIELDIDNLTEGFRKRKIIRDIERAIDSTGGGLTGEDGKPLIPVFISETISKYYHRHNPDRTKEDVIKTKIDGVGMGADSPVSQLLGSSNQEYNFYRNWLSIFGKDFVSPLADGWKAHYDYYLADTMWVGEHWCYKIEVTPRRVADLAFEGTIWIDSISLALKQIDVTVGKKANINYIERLRIQQELTPTEAGPWLPVKTRVLTDVGELTKKSAGVIAKFYVSSKDFVINKKYPMKFYEERMTVSPTAHIYEKDYWQQSRHDSLTPAELQTYALIDTIKQVPIVKAYSDIINVLNSGYLTWGKLDFGNYLYTYAFNDVEGQRGRLGIRTNDKFSRIFEFKGYLAYGTADKRFKYSGRVRFIPNRKHWTEFAVERKEDIIQFAVNPDGVAVPGAFVASLNFFNVSRRSPFYKTENSAYLERDLVKGVTQTIRFRNTIYTQIGNHFAYYAQPESPETSPKVRDFTISEVILETRLAKDERFYYTGNYRYTLGTAKLPVFTLRYTVGLKGVLDSDFNYHKFAINMEQSINTGTFGRAYYAVTASYTPSRLPYPLLEVHLGNRGNFYNFYGYSLMNFMEFVSDRHISLNFENNFNGFLFNRIPLIKKFKWRTFIAGNLLWGGLSQANQDLIPRDIDEPTVNPVNQVFSLGKKPYAELGYGISNVLKFFRITFLHRVTYRDNPGIRRFGVFFSARFDL